MAPRLFPDEPQAPVRRKEEGLSIDPADRPYYAGESEPRSGGWLRNLIVLAIMLFCAGALYVAYNRSKPSDAGAGGVLPLIRADQDPTKRKPDDAGGSVPDQDKLVYNPNDPNGGKVERLLPPPEQPLPKPVPLTQAPLPSQTVAPVATPQALASTGRGGAPADAAIAPATVSGNLVAPPGAKAVAGIEIPPAPPPTPATTPAPGKPIPLTPAAGKPVAPAAQSVASPTVPAPVPPPAQSSAATGPVRIQIAATKDEASARAEFARLQKAHADLLGNLQATVVKADLGDKGIFYRIQAGPIGDRVQADKLCAQLKPLGIGCLVVH